MQILAKCKQWKGAGIAYSCSFDYWTSMTQLHFVFNQNGFFFGTSWSILCSYSIVVCSNPNWSCQTEAVYLFLLRSSLFRSAGWPLAVAVKKPLREWVAWLPVPYRLINDLLLELATNLKRDWGGVRVKKKHNGTKRAMKGKRRCQN